MEHPVFLFAKFGNHTLEHLNLCCPNDLLILQILLASFPLSVRLSPTDASWDSLLLKSGSLEVEPALGSLTQVIYWRGALEGELF